MKTRKTLFGILFVTMALLNSCNNFFHELLPPPNNDIISFAVQFPDGTHSATSRAIENQVVTVTVPDGTDLANLVPVVQVSEKATVFPGTLPYLNKIFPDRDLMHLAVQMNNAFKEGTFEDWFLKIVLETKNIKIPKLDMPVDFTSPVYFCVISGDGNHKIYTVKVLTETEKIIEDTGIEPSGADNFILTFEVPSQRGETSIIHESSDSNTGKIDFVMEQGNSIHSLLPQITISDGSKILPLTMEYILNCGFTYEQMLSFYTGYSTASDTTKYVTTFLRRATNIVYPEIVQPLDFSSVVPFAVVGSDGGIRIYNVNCSVYDGNPLLEKVYFSKVNNPYLLKDLECENFSNSFSGQATYPDEMEVDYSLIPDIVFVGDKVTYTINGGAETELISGVTSIPFTSTIRSCTITVYRDGNTKSYNLDVDIGIDPDTIRSITDYRFKVYNNNDIKNTVIASIYNEGDTGFISAKILYEGSIAPYNLVADFITPGTVTTADTLEGSVPGTFQKSGVTSNNFQYSRKFLCASKNGLYTRLYTVNIEFVQVVPAEVAIKSFEFPVYLNSDLSQDSVATINDADGSIRCQVTYASETIPKNLVPEFAATGTVSCRGVTQTSGYTANNFTYNQYYTVTVEDEFYGTVTKTYKVEVVFKQDAASACELLTFGFATEDNPSLTNDVSATITQRNGSVYAFMPFGAGSTEGNALVPYFTAEGTVSVNGAPQTSGASSQDFSSPVTYTVTSANGRYSKDYTVMLQERGAIIYVDSEAYGLNNGTSWQDAYISLDFALEQAALMPAECAAEIWVTAPEGKVYASTEKTGFKLYKEGSITILGGFDGTEKNASDRQFDSNGNLVKRTKIQNYDNGANGIFECNYLIKDYVYIEGLANTENNCDEFFYCIPTTGTRKTEPSFIDSNITINDCEFYSMYITRFYSIDSYDLTISNSKTRMIRDSKNGGGSFHIENCTFLETEKAYVYLYTAGEIKFNNNTMYGYANINLISPNNEIEFENNELLESDKIEIYQDDYFTGTKVKVDEPVWALYICGACNLVFENSVFDKMTFSDGASAEINDCDFIDADAGCLYVYDGLTNVIVNNSRFNNVNISSGSNLTLNNCDVSGANGSCCISIWDNLTMRSCTVEGGPGLYASETSSLYIDGGTYKFGELNNTSSSGMNIKNATVTAELTRYTYLTENSVIDNSTVSLNLSNYGCIKNYSDNITNTDFNFSGECGTYAWSQFSMKLSNCNFDFTNLNMKRSGVYIPNSCIITNCSFNGATNTSVFVDDECYPRGGAIYITLNEEKENILFENCIFSNNKVVNGATVGSNETGGGAVAIAFFANDSDVIFKDCSFMNNYSNTGLASHIWASANWKDEGEYSGCSFVFFGTTTMTGPEWPGDDYLTSYGKNEAVCVYNVGVGIKTGTFN